MARIDQVEFYGRQVATGKLSRGRAAELLFRASEGGLTVRGAAESVDNWRTRREEYERGYFAAHESMRYWSYRRDHATTDQEG